MLTEELHLLFSKDEHISEKQLKSICDIPDNIFDDDLNLINNMFPEKCFERFQEIVKIKKKFGVVCVLLQLQRKI